MSARTAGKRIGLQGMRVVALVGLLAVSGVVIGLAAGFPLRYVKFEQSDAVTLAQNSLAGQIDPKTALVALDDLPAGWTPGDPALAATGMLGSQFCGRSVELPTPLSGAESAVFANTTDNATVVAQAQRFDRASSARQYVQDVNDALGKCSSFFVGDPPQKVEIKDARGKAPITDYVSAAFVHTAGNNVLEWSMMSVGDVVISIVRAGPTRPSASFLNDVERNVLVRIDPTDFGSSAIPVESTVPDTAPATTEPGG